MCRKLQFDAFLRAFALSKTQSFGFLFGAGCSVSSGVPAASRCIWDWKRMLYISNNPTNSSISIDSESDKKENQRWCNLQPGYPKHGDPSEYVFYVEEAMPQEDIRRRTNIKTFKIGEKTIDFHDYIKSFAAQSNIPTQIIEEKTLSSSLSCAKHWWVSLAIFVKSGRVPWTMADLDQNSAYAGIGYAIDTVQQKGKQNESLRQNDVSEAAKRQNDVLETPLSFSERLSLKEMAVIRLIASDSKISIASITAKTGLSRRTIDRTIAALKDNGILTREGAKNNATWIINSPQK